MRTVEPTPATRSPFVDQRTWPRVAAYLDQVEALLHTGVDVADPASVSAVLDLANAARRVCNAALDLVGHAEGLHTFAVAVRGRAAATYGPIWTSWLRLATMSHQDLMPTRMYLIELYQRRLITVSGFPGGPALDPVRLQPNIDICLSVNLSALDAFIINSTP